MELEPKRARRRRQTHNVSRQRRRLHLDRAHGGNQAHVDCVCELASTYFAKRVPNGCGCRKRRKGRPRLAAGLCTIGGRDRVYRWRRQARELNQRLSRR